MVVEDLLTKALSPECAAASGRLLVALLRKWGIKREVRVVVVVLDELDSRSVKRSILEIL